MKTKDFYFDSSDHRHLTYAKYWLPEGKPIGILQIIHGMKEHTGRYEEFAEFMTSNGFMVCANDLLGHGLTAAGEDLGFFGYNHGVKHLLNDIEILLDRTQSEYPDTPYFFLGFSMGSYLERILISNPTIAEKLSGAIIAGTSRKSPNIQEAIEAAKSAVSKNGPKAVSASLDSAATGSFGDAFPNEDDPSAWVTSIKGRQKYYNEDPKSQFDFTNAAMRDLFTIVAMAGDDTTFTSTDRRLPILLISGKDDPLGEFGKGIREVANKYIDAGSDDISMRIFPKVRHDVIYDFPATQNKSQPFILNWIKTHIA